MSITIGNFVFNNKNGVKKELDISIFKIDPTIKMVNITKIANAFGKRVRDWKNTEQTQQLIDAYQRRENTFEKNQVITEVKGGSKSGTWVCEDLAYDFALWISVGFKVWCLSALKELFHTGKVELTNRDNILIAYDKQLDLLNEKRDTYIVNQITNQGNGHYLGDVPDIIFRDYKIHIGRNKLYGILRFYGVMKKDKFVDMPLEEHVKNGHFIRVRTDDDKIKPFVTTKGLAYLIKLLRKRDDDFNADWMQSQYTQFGEQLSLFDTTETFKMQK